MIWLVLLLAGGLGTVLRRGLGLLAVRWLGEGLPFATLVPNIAGSFLLGIVFRIGADRELCGVDARVVLGTGLLGGFTTYSSFNLETLLLVQQGAFGRALLYVASTVVACLLFGALGLKAGQFVVGG
ncbi:MAG: CrcB family protein [Myxococcales bacterium]|nr:CrcB family protein [Myxococcales bacterium]